MTPELTIALLSGGFALAGGLGGVALSARMTKTADKARRIAEDDRRWQADRRTIYAQYLGLASSMLHEIDGVAAFLTYSGTEEVSDEDENLTKDGLFEYLVRWDNELQPALGEVQLLASPPVADLADRVSGALMELTATIELRGAFTSHYPMWFQAEDLLSVLRAAMRRELGVAGGLDEQRRREDDWPWLSDRPSRSSYVQDHSARSDRITSEGEAAQATSPSPG